MKLINKILRNQTLVFTIGGALPTFLNFIFLPIYSHYLTPEDFGIFSYIMAIQSVLLILTTLSLNNFLLRGFFDFKEAEAVKRFFGTILVFLSLFNLLFLFVIYLMTPFIFKAVALDQSIINYFYLMIFALFFEYLFMFPLVFYRLNKKAFKYVLFNALRQVCSFFVAILLISQLEYSILGRFIAILSVNIFFALIAYLIMHKRIRFSLDLALLKKALSFSLPLIPASLLGASYVALDKIILINYISFELLGIYTLAAAIASTSNFISLGYYRAIEPIIYENYMTKGFDQRVNEMIKFLLIIMMMFSLFICIFSKELLIIFFHPSFSSASGFIIFFLLSFLLNGQRRIYITVLHANKITSYDIIINIVGLVVFLGVFFSAVPQLGVYGALISLIAGSLSSFLIAILIASRFARIKTYMGYILCFFIFNVPIYFFYEMGIFENYVAILSSKIFLALIILLSGIKYLSLNRELIPE